MRVKPTRTTVLLCASMVPLPVAGSTAFGRIEDQSPCRTETHDLRGEFKGWYEVAPDTSEHVHGERHRVRSDLLQPVTRTRRVPRSKRRPRGSRGRLAKLHEPRLHNTHQERIQPVDDANRGNLVAVGALVGMGSIGTVAAIQNETKTGRRHCGHQWTHDWSGGADRPLVSMPSAPDELRRCAPAAVLP